MNTPITVAKTNTQIHRDPNLLHLPFTTFICPASDGESMKKNGK